jgi:hypothetical protein
VSSDHIIPTPHLSLSTHSPPSPLPQQLQKKQQLPSYSNPIVGATTIAAKFQQQQHASLTFLSQKKQSSHLPRNSSTSAQNVWPRKKEIVYELAWN